MDINKIKIYTKKYGFYVCLASVFLLAFVIRINNVFQYNTWWADDGGAHIMYIEIVLDDHRLPTSQENYLAWHDPGYYFFMAGWTWIGELFGLEKNSLLNWQEIIGVVFSLLFLILVYYFTFALTKNKWLALLNTFLISILFVSVKLSAYVNNELPVQLAIFGLAILFWRWQLLEAGKRKLVFYWAVILALAMLIKLTAVLVLLAVLLIWVLFFLIKKKKHVLIYILLTLITVITINLPWLVYKKQNFGNAFSTNIHEQENKQPIFKSDAWGYLFKLNFRFILDNPYWETQPHSFTSIFIADTFSNYYNLFNDVDEANAFPNSDKLKTSNNRFAVSNSWKVNLWANRLGVLIVFVWVIGLLGSIYERFKTKKMRWYELFLWILMIGGFSALVYNNLRHPYLERGVLKAHFIYFIFPLITLFAYSWWWKILKENWLKFVILFLPILLYTLISLPILLV